MRWRAVGYGLVADYVAVLALAGIGGTTPEISGFYALFAPARLAPLLAGSVAGGVGANPEQPARDAVRTGVVHAAAVVGAVLLAGVLTVVAGTRAGPLLVLAVLAGGVILWRRAGRWRLRVPVVAGVLVGLGATLGGRLRRGVATVAEGAVLVPRMGAFAFLGPTRYGRGWTLLGVWVLLTLFGGALGAALVSRFPGSSTTHDPASG